MLPGSLAPASGRPAADVGQGSLHVSPGFPSGDGRRLGVPEVPGSTAAGPHPSAELPQPSGPAHPPCLPGRRRLVLRKCPARPCFGHPAHSRTLTPQTCVRLLPITPTLLILRNLRPAWETCVIVFTARSPRASCPLGLAQGTVPRAPSPSVLQLRLEHRPLSADCRIPFSVGWYLSEIPFQIK